MRLATITISLIASLSLAVASARSIDLQVECPKVQVSCPDEVPAGERATVTVEVTGGPADVTPTYNWTVSAGTIESGQGTSVIMVDLSEVASETSVTATVDVGGYDRNCSTAASCTTYVRAKDTR